MNIIDTPFDDLLIFEPDIFSDNRGWFMESFNQYQFELSLQTIIIHFSFFVLVFV